VLARGSNEPEPIPGCSIPAPTSFNCSSTEPR
jgi:hypothetical protein